MKTSIRSKAFCSITDRQTDKYFQNRCSFMRGICTKKYWSDISIRGRENPKPDGHTDRRTDICFYMVALLLKKDQLYSYTTY